MKFLFLIYDLFLVFSFSAANIPQPHSPGRSTTDTVSVQIIYADSVTRSSAKLAGRFTASGVPTRCYFQWGTTTMYGHQSPPVLITDPEGRSERIEYTITGLSPNTLYHFRVAAEDTISTTHSKDRAFFTTDAHLTTMTADSVTTTSAALHMLCNPAGLRLNVYFLYGIDSLTYELQSPLILVDDSTQITEISLVAQDLTPNTTYYYFPVATGVDFPSLCLKGSRESFTTLSDPYIRGFVVPLELRNQTGVRISGPILFGVHTHASYCKDIGLGEHEVPPSPPLGTPELRFVDQHGFSDCMGLGLYWDLRHFYSTTQVDTYMVRVQPDNTGYPLILSWSDLNPYYSGAVRLLDPYTGTLHNTNMKAQTSDTIRILLDQLLIVAEGPLNLVGSKLTMISENGALLGGSFTPNGAPAHGWFEWGDTTDYGMITPATDLGNGTSAVDFSCALAGLRPNSTYHFRAVVQSSDGNINGPDQAFRTNVATGIGRTGKLPTGFALHPNYPNPFNPSTIIRYDLPWSAHVLLILYDVLGREIRTLVDEAQSPGTKELRIDASSFGNGVYFCRMRAGAFVASRKLILVK